MRTIGTAGHVDHGKTALVRRLTGMNPDRLAEEKRRQLTIDLGFAWFELGGASVSVVDVPGHRDFIENMLAGAGGLDAVLLVVAADEGVMPQTKEHLAIIDLLGIERGVVALTKVDRVDDLDWLALVESDLRDTLRNTTLQTAPLVRTSAKTGAGLDQLRDELQTILDNTPPQRDRGQPTLPVDRAFTVAGFGTVVTGTLSGGALRVGEAVDVQPGDLRGRVRGLQRHKQPVDVALPGSRVAVNLANINVADVSRGQVLTLPGQIQPTQLVDVYYRHLASLSRPLKHNQTVKLFTGAAGTMARVRLLGVEALAPGDDGYLQLRLDDMLAVISDSHFILRDPAQRVTLGGGKFIHVHPDKHYKRFDRQTLRHLTQKHHGSPADKVVLAATGTQALTRDDLQQQSGLNEAEFAEGIRVAMGEGRVSLFAPDGVYLATESVARLQARMLAILNEHHAANPVQWGMDIAALRARLDVEAVLFDWLIDKNDVVLYTDGGRVRHVEHYPDYTDEQLQRIRALFERIEENPVRPPTIPQAVAILGEAALLDSLADVGEIVIVSETIFFDVDTYEWLVMSIMDTLEAAEAVTIAGVRDRFGTSRRYTRALLEHLDGQGITRRVGDRHVRRRS